MDSGFRRKDGIHVKATVGLPPNSRDDPWFLRHGGQDHLCHAGVASWLPKGLNTGTPVGSKCLTLRVTTVRPCSKAVAAIIRSTPVVTKHAGKTPPPVGRTDVETLRPYLRTK